jgi:hypothetical protein
VAQRLTDYEPGVVPGQCCACGAYDEAEWSVTVIRDASPDMRAHYRLCETCYRMVTTLLMNPEREREKLRGYR